MHVVEAAQLKLPSQGQQKKSRRTPAVDEVTFEEQLKQIGQLQLPSAEPAGGSAARAPSAAPGGKAPPKAESLRTVLIQALHSGDNSLLEYCLSVSDKKVIDRTIAKLPSEYVLPFLQHVIDKFQAKPSRGVTLVVWIKSILISHTAHLLAVPELTATLSPLYQTVDERMQSFKPMLKLSGRLDLVMSQISLRREQNVDVDLEPAAVYVEDEDEDMHDGDDDEDESDEDAYDEDSYGEEDSSEVVVRGKKAKPKSSLDESDDESEESDDDDDDDEMSSAGMEMDASDDDDESS